MAATPRGDVASEHQGVGCTRPRSRSQGVRQGTARTAGQDCPAKMAERSGEDTQRFPRQALPHLSKIDSGRSGRTGLSPQKPGEDVEIAFDPGSGEATPPSSNFNHTPPRPTP